MPVTESPFPLLSHFIRVVEQTTGMPPQPLTSSPDPEVEKSKDKTLKPKQLPKGVVLGPDGKP